MNRKSLITTLGSICHDKFIQSKTQTGTGLKYIHIFDRPYDSMHIGVTENGFWCICNKGIIHPVETKDQAYVFYLLLYCPINEIINLIKKGLKNQNLPEIIVITFPFDELLLGAFQVQNEWWNLALKWVDQGYPLNDEMRCSLWGDSKQNKMWLKYQTERLNRILDL